MTKKIVGGYTWRQEITRARNANRAARSVLRRIAEETPGPHTLAMLLLKAANALGENLDALQELEAIGADARANSQEEGA